MENKSQSHPRALESPGLSLSAVISTGRLRKPELMIADLRGGCMSGVRDMVRPEVYMAYRACCSGVTEVQLFTFKVESLPTLPHQAPRCNFPQWAGRMNSACKEGHSYNVPAWESNRLGGIL